MSTNHKEFHPNAEQKDFLDQLITTYYVLINNVTGLHPSEIKMDDSAADVFEEQEVYGYTLAKMHLYHNLEIEYDAYTEFEKFPTLGDAYNYIAERALVSQGLINEEEL